MLHRISMFTTVILFMSLSVFADTHHEGVQSGTWTPAGNTHLIDDDCWIPPRSTLNIEAGCLVEFQGHYCIIDSGTFNAIGTTESPIIFTSHPDSQFAGYWKALIADGASGSLATMTLTNCEICYGGESEVSPTATSGPVRAFGYAMVTVSYCYIHNSLGDGAGSNTENNQLTVTDSRIDSCDIGLKLANLSEASEARRNRIVSCGVGIYHHGIQGPVTNNFIDSSTVCGSSGYFINFSNNIIARTLNGGNGIEITDGVVENYSIANNILYYNTGWGIYWSDPENPLTVRNNCYFANTQGNRYSVTDLDPLDNTDPVFVGAGFGDEAFYHLRWNSPCLGAGDDELTNSNPAISRSMP
jgi:hypothetical protein